jgi:hypothetical protein
LRIINGGYLLDFFSIGNNISPSQDIEAAAYLTADLFTTHATIRLYLGHNGAEGIDYGMPHWRRLPIAFTEVLK